MGADDRLLRNRVVFHEVLYITIAQKRKQVGGRIGTFWEKWERD
jgi:hypothetical protein